MFEWKHKIGVIYIASSTTLEREWHIILPKEISFHVARIRLQDATKESLWEMVTSKEIEEAAEKLADAEPDIILFGCTIGSLIGGANWDKELAARIQKVTGIPTTTTSTEVINALKEMKCKKVTVVTPYLEELNKLEKEFIESAGIQVLNIKGFNKKDDRDIAKIPPAEIANLAKTIDSPDSDCVFISCTNIRSIEIIPSLEKDLNKPVISSNLASLWGVFKKLGYRKPIHNFGILLEKYL